MSHELPRDEYIEVHRATLEGLIDRGEMVPRFHVPHVVATAISGTAPLIVEIDQHPLDSFQTDDIEGVDAHNNARQAGSTLEFFTKITERVTAAAIESPFAVDDQSPEKNAHDREVVERIVEVVKGSSRRYYQTAFQLDDPPELLRIETASMRNERAQFGARQLILACTEQGVERILTITSVSPDEESRPSLFVHQNLALVRDEMIAEIAEFLVTEGDDINGLRTVQAIFDAEVHGLTTDEVAADLIANYQDPNKQQIGRLVRLIQERGRGARESLALTTTNLDLTRPTGPQLEEYQALFDLILG